LTVIEQVLKGLRKLAVLYLLSDIHDSAGIEDNRGQVILNLIPIGNLKRMAKQGAQVPADKHTLPPVVIAILFCSFFQVFREAIHRDRGQEIIPPTPL
jgi:hypothetical protein